MSGSVREGIIRTLREIALERKVPPPKELEEILDYKKMTEPDE